MEQKDYKKMDAAIVGNLEHFYPHYEENAEHIAPEGNFRPTWYTQFRLANGGMLYTMYEGVKDLCISTIFGPDGILTMMHSGYPSTQADAEVYANAIIRHHHETKDGKIKTNSGKIFEVTFTIEGDETKNTVNKDGERVQTKFSYMVYAVNEEHARQIVSAYDEKAVIERVEEQGNAISQHYGG